MGDKIVTIVMSIVLALIIFFGIPFVMLFWSVGSNNEIDLRNIDNENREEIIELMGLSDMSNDIELIKAERPTVYRDIYYKIYFYCDNDKVLQKKENNDVYGRDFIDVKDNEYSCTIYRLDDGQIDLLENLFEKIKMN